MSSAEEWTPATRNIRSSIPSVYITPTEFDRWLEAHDAEVRAEALGALNESFLHMRDRVAGYVSAPPVVRSFDRGAYAFEWAAAQVRQVRDGGPLLNPPDPATLS